MSAVPEFLIFGCKQTEPTDLKRPILLHIVRTYSKEKAYDISSDLEEVSKRRTELIAATGSKPNDRIKEILFSYYRALCVVEQRIPIGREFDQAQVSFAWTSANAVRTRYMQMNVYFEKASVLFNIAAIAGRRGAFEKREDQESYKSAIQHFQEAAASFNLAKEAATRLDKPVSPDLRSEFLTFAEKLMLAQAQECVFWRAMKDDKSPLTLSKVAKSASVLYSEALRLVVSPSVREGLERNWQEYIQSKSWLFETLCQLNAAEEANSQEEITVEIARLNQAKNLVKKLKKTGKFFTSSLPAFIKDLKVFIKEKLQSAEKKNASVYFKKIPPFDQLPTVDGIQIVKLVLPSGLDASNETVFGNLIPKTVTRSLDRYSELVDRLIRQEVDKLNGASNEAQGKLSQYELPGILDMISISNLSSIPEPLRKELEDIQQANGLSYLDELHQQVGAFRENAMSDLKTIEHGLDEETALDFSLKEQYGETWNAPSSNSQTSELRKQITSYKKSLESAHESDQVIQVKLIQSRENFTGLELQKVLDKIPRLDARNSTSPSGSESVSLVKNLKTILRTLVENSNKRSNLENAFKEMKNKDNLLSRLSSTSAPSHDEVFTEELKKYNPLKEQVEESMNKHNETMDDLVRAYGAFEQIYDVKSWRQQMDQFCEDLKSTVTTFQDVKNDIVEGTQFYTKLREAIHILKGRSDDYLMSRKTDRDDRLEQLKATEEAQRESTKEEFQDTESTVNKEAPSSPTGSFPGFAVIQSPDELPRAPSFSFGEEFHSTDEPRA